MQLVYPTEPANWGYVIVVKLSSEKKEKVTICVFLNYEVQLFGGLS